MSITLIVATSAPPYLGIRQRYNEDRLLNALGATSESAGPSFSGSTLVLEHQDKDLANRYQVAKDGRTGRTGRTASETRHLEKTTEHDHLFRISPRLSTIERARPLGNEN